MFGSGRRGGGAGEGKIRSGRETTGKGGEMRPVEERKKKKKRRWTRRGKGVTYKKTDILYTGRH